MSDRVLPDGDGIAWDRYPRTAGHAAARDLLLLEHALGRAPNTLDAYARSREDFFALCAELGIAPESATREHLALWVRDLSSRPSRHGQDRDPGRGLSNATLQLRLTAVRLFFDFLLERGIRQDNPVGRGRFTPGKAFAARSSRGLVPRHRKLPWIPNDLEWAALLRAIELEPLRNRVMFALSYDAALRREELCSLEISDLDFAHRLLTVRAETTKSRATRVVPFSAASGTLLGAYLHWRRSVTTARGPMFISESKRNFGQPISIWTWSKVAERVAAASGVARFSTHTFRHLCLTDLARAGWDIHEIATFAGHRTIESTRHYVHLSGRDLAEKLESGMAQVHAWRIGCLEDHLK
jgi:site-specific recombinase XerD